MIKGPAYTDLSNGVSVSTLVNERIARYSPRLSLRQAYGRPGHLSALWLAGSPKDETNDCSVRALSMVSDMTYEQAHTLIAERCKRVRGKGPAASLYRQLIDSLASCVYRPGEGGVPYRREARMTLARFVAEHPRGVYLVWITGHALALIDGKIIDSHVSKPRTRLEYAWKFAD